MGDLDLNWTKSDFENAVTRLRNIAHLPLTPLKRSIWLSKEIEGEVFLKWENVQESNSFKLRGATNFILSYHETHGHYPTRVITASGGNHGLAVAAACWKLNIPCIVILPTNSVTPTKVHLLHDCFGADVEVLGSCFQEANDIGVQMVKEKYPDGCYIHPYAHKWIIQGAGTIFSDLQEQMSAPPDVIIGSLGGGGMIAGLITARNAYEQKDIQIDSVETEGADYYAQSHKAGKLISLEKITSIAVTLGASTGTQVTFDLFEENITNPWVVSDAEAIDALWKLINYERIIVEPSCSASVAALLKNKEYYKGKRVVVIICGGNASIEECQKWKEQFLSN